jgi:hypothetical protein
MVVVLFKSMGEILLFQVLVVTQEPECCCGNAAGIMMCTYYIIYQSMGNVSGKLLSSMKLSNLTTQKNMSYSEMF